MSNHPFLLHRFSEHAWLIQFDQVIDEQLSIYIHALARHLKNQFPRGIEIVAAYNSILVEEFSSSPYYLPGENVLHRMLQDFEPIKTNNASNHVIDIPVCYDNVLENDLLALSVLSGITTDEIIRRHSERTYYVYLIGFLPGFAYMGTVHEAIAFARKEKPVATKAGAVGIAGKQTGIYPTDSPGGWQIVGYTPYSMFDIEKAQPAKLQPGNRVRFVPIDIATYKSLKEI